MAKLSLKNYRSIVPHTRQNKVGKKPKKYGGKVNIQNLQKQPPKYTKVEDLCLYHFYQLQLWNKSYIDAKLNVVVIIWENLVTKKKGHCILFSTDMNIECEKIVSYYSSRFQIEFNFRDAKQFFGLADFKNYKEVQVRNAVNLSFFMCNLSYILSKNFKELFNLEKVSIFDLKIYYRTEYIVNQLVKVNNIKSKKAIQFFNPFQIFEIAKNHAVNF